MNEMGLLQLAPYRQATVAQVVAPSDAPVESGLLTRLGELGFLPGESVCVLRRGPGGREPIAVQIGDTVFALRAIEANCVRVKASP